MGGRVGYAYMEALDHGPKQFVRRLLRGSFEPTQELARLALEIFLDLTHYRTIKQLIAADPVVIGRQLRDRHCLSMEWMIRHIDRQPLFVPGVIKANKQLC